MVQLQDVICPRIPFPWVHSTDVARQFGIPFKVFPPNKRAALDLSVCDKNPTPLLEGNCGDFSVPLKHFKFFPPRLTHKTLFKEFFNGHGLALSGKVWLDRLHDGLDVRSVDVKCAVEPFEV